jgi:hypothetical protein
MYGLLDAPHVRTDRRHLGLNSWNMGSDGHILAFSIDTAGMKQDPGAVGRDW